MVYEIRGRGFPPNIVDRKLYISPSFQHEQEEAALTGSLFKRKFKGGFTALKSAS